MDPSTGEVLFAKNSDRSVPIASLTKLMTALVFLEQKPSLDREGLFLTMEKLYANAALPPAWGNGTRLMEMQAPPPAKKEGGQ